MFCLVFGGSCLEKWNHHLDAAMMRGRVNSAELLTWVWKFRSVIDCDLFLFTYSFRCVSAAFWSLHSGALARPSGVRPFLAHIAIVITSLFVCLFVCVSPLWERQWCSSESLYVWPPSHLPCSEVGPGIGAGQWAMSRGMWGTSSFQHRKRCELSVCLAMLGGMWRPNDQSGNSDYCFSLDFWAPWTRSRLSVSEE